MKIKNAGVVLAATMTLSSAASAATMQAAVVVDGHAIVQTVAKPAADAGEVIVKLYDAGVNPVDWKMAHGPESRQAPPPLQPAAQPAQPLLAIPGFDGSGVVEWVGAGVQGFKVGDSVIVWSKARGTYAEYIAVPADTIVRKPAALSFAQAAGIPQASFAAWNMLVDVAAVKPGQRVLVLGGSGGVGSAAVQIAHNLGVHVIATASAQNAEFVRGLGADEVIDYKAEAFESRLKDLDVVINTVDADNASRAVGTIRRGGWLVSLVGMPSEQCAAAGIRCSSRTMDGTSIGDVLRQLAVWAEQGKYTVAIDRTFALAETNLAWDYSESGHTRGKSVIRLVASP